MSAQPPTLHDLFESWKEGNTEFGSWSDHWHKEWERHLSMYFERDWHLIPTAHNSKKPLAHYHWDVEVPLTREKAMEFVKSGCNIAVVFGPSKLVGLDFDTQGPEWLSEAMKSTLSMRTPRGYQLFYRADIGTNGKRFSTLAKGLKDGIPGLDKVRVGIMYSLLPHSVTNASEKGHDFRVRQWLPGAQEPMKFTEFCKGVKGLGL